MAILDFPVTNLHFWVINTGFTVAGKPSMPVTNLHFWVINTTIH